MVNENVNSIYNNKRRFSKMKKGVVTPLIKPLTAFTWLPVKSLCLYKTCCK